MCQYQENQSASPVYGDGYPASAQGACLPGDEAGEVCRFSGEIIAAPCENCPHEGDVRECHAYTKASTYCPHCLGDASEKIEMYAHRHGSYHCPECGNEYSATDLISSLSQRAADYFDRMENGLALLIENKRLTEQIEDIRKVVAA